MPPSKYVGVSGSEKESWFADIIVLGNVDTAEEIRTLRGHQAGIRALQFDDSKLISGSLDSMFCGPTLLRAHADLE